MGCLRKFELLFWKVETCQTEICRCLCCLLLWKLHSCCLMLSLLFVRCFCEDRLLSSNLNAAKNVLREAGPARHFPCIQVYSLSGHERYQSKCRKLKLLFLCCCSMVFITSLNIRRVYWVDCLGEDSNKATQRLHGAWNLLPNKNTIFINFPLSLEGSPWRSTSRRDARRSSGWSL